MNLLKRYNRTIRVSFWHRIVEAWLEMKAEQNQMIDP